MSKPTISPLFSFNATIPGEPVAQGRPRATVVNGQARVYDPKRSRNWKAYAVGIIQTKLGERARPVFGERVPVELHVILFFARPASRPKTKRTDEQPKVTLPDCDNLLKAVCDAMTAAGVWHDDRQVYWVTVEKYECALGDSPRVIVGARGGIAGGRDVIGAPFRSERLG